MNIRILPVLGFLTFVLPGCGESGTNEDTVPAAGVTALSSSAAAAGGTASILELHAAFERRGAAAAAAAFLRSPAVKSKTAELAGEPLAPVVVLTGAVCENGAFCDLTFLALQRSRERQGCATCIVEPRETVATVSAEVSLTVNADPVDESSVTVAVR